MALTARYPRLAWFVVIVFGVAMRGNITKGEEGPSIAKDSVQVLAAHISGSEDAPKEKQLQWKPGMSFKVNGPIADGSQLYLVFSYPGHKDFAKFDCKTSETQEGQTFKVEE